jgi:UrcA family protein
MKTTTHTSLKSVACTMAALAITCLADVAHAAPPADAALTKVVSYADLDLNSPKGLEVLYARIRGASREVCVPFEARDLKSHSLWSRCYNDAMTAAIRDAHRPALTAMHRQALGQSVQPDG